MESRKHLCLGRSQVYFILLCHWWSAFDIEYRMNEHATNLSQLCGAKITLKIYILLFKSLGSSWV